MLVLCKKCGNLWEYHGSRKRIACSNPNCRTSITITQKDFENRMSRLLTKGRRFF